MTRSALLFRLNRLLRGARLSSSSDPGSQQNGFDTAGRRTYTEREKGLNPALDILPGKKKRQPGPFVMVHFPAPWFGLFRQRPVPVGRVVRKGT